MRVGRLLSLTKVRFLAILAFSAGVFLHPVHAHGQLGDLIIDELNITGVTVFSEKEIESVLDVMPGAAIDRSRLIRTQDHLRELYRNRGYDDVELQSRLLKRKGQNGRSQLVLEIKITEGKPTRIASVHFIPRNMHEGLAKSFWVKMEAALLSKTGLATGDIVDLDRIGNIRRTVQDALVSEEFIGARVDEIRTSVAREQVAATGLPTGRWVNLEFHVNLGDRVTFGFRGNTVFTMGKLTGFIEEQRLVGLGKDYVDAIKNRIEVEYKALGYAEVRVTPFTFENAHRSERHVTYEILEGPRAKIETLEIEGAVQFRKQELVDKFFSKASPLVQGGIYVEKDVEKAADLMIEWMKSKGYLFAKVITVNAATIHRYRGNRRGSFINLSLYIYEGEQTIVQGIDLAGVSAFSKDLVIKILGIEDEKPLNLFALNEGLEALKVAYRSKGFLNSRIVNEGTDQLVQYSDENRFASIHLVVDEGPVLRVGRIEVEGLGQTNPEVVHREVKLREGDVLEEPKIADVEARLRKLGIFSVVHVKTLDDPSAGDRKILKISVQEGTPGLVSGGIGFRNDLGVRLFGQTDYKNLWGRNHTLSFGVQTNRRFQNFHFAEYQAQLSYLWPWFALGETSFRPAITLSGIQYIQLDATSLSLSFTWERKLVRNPNLVSTLSYNLERTHLFNAINSENNRQVRIGAVSPALKLDLRDNALAPTSGFLAIASYDWAAPWFLSQTENPIHYSRFQFRTDYLLPLKKDITWYFSFRSGYEVNHANVDSPECQGSLTDPRCGGIPFIKQFTLGGVSSLRGFGEQELRLTDGDLLRGSASYVNYRTQLDLPFSGALRFGPFVDAANLNVDRFSFGGLRYGAGVGFHYQTPVGPVNLDWGFKVNPRPGEDPFRFYFSIGII